MPAVPPSRPLPTRARVLVVGAGFSGLATAIGLRRAGVDDVVVLDRGDDVGGTWRDNTYPGAACDIPSQLYSFSFALNPDWTSSYSSQPEILRYLRGVADRSGVRDRLWCGVTMTAARWDPAALEWEVTTTAGTVRAPVLVLGTGALSEPRLPDLPGLADFAGPVFHSARWDHGADLSGRRVAVVGTGASAVQIVPRLAEVTAHLDVYQRTPPWVLPRHDRRYGRMTRAALRRVPGLQRAARGAVWAALEVRVLGFVVRPGLLARGQVLARAHLRRAVADPALRAALTPTYTMGCKRILVSSDYYPALARPTTTLVTDPIARVTPTAVVTADGTERPTDAVVVATGFRVLDNPLHDHVVGRVGRSLAAHWAAEGHTAYKGITVPEFPNLFLLLGPNTGLGHSSMVQMAEGHAAYVVDAVRHLQRSGRAAVEVRRDAHDRYAADVQRRMQRTVWATGGCASWYLDERGRIAALWPDWTRRFRRLVQRFDAEAYVGTPLAPSRAS